ncbi:MAG TPA: prepilin-type N-terminal cleavage/methylation domain-containing protein, partial [Polyangiaceae bacterium]|nr:prepilin-type N-terminal cleavage/methylation domain-containing protein [Polyangiaceae bacterium]
MTQPKALRRRSDFARGFTLVELMVALSGGLFLSVMVFALARDTSRFYQRENRLANATLAGMMGFERLKADIARAGFLSTPNIVSDPMVCMNPAAGRPAMLQTLASIRINPNTPAANAALALNGLTPDELILAGSYQAT